jgi:signal-transduction protein with cAMP-binding, CBS, and nucleotidyltransferase domain
MEPLMKLDIPQAGKGLQQRLMEDAVSHLNPLPPLTLPADAPVINAIQLMKGRGVGCVLALEGNRLVGILSERDLLYKLAGAQVISEHIKLKDVMTTRLVTLGMDDSIRFALHQMSIGGFRHIPITEEKRPIGIISIKDVLRYINRAILQHQQDEASSSAIGG